MQWHQAKHKVKTPVTAITKEKKKTSHLYIWFHFQASAMIGGDK